MTIKRCFLFGAGAEVYFGMPTGADFLHETLFKNVKDIDEDIAQLYQNTEKHEFYSKYSKQDFLIRSSKEKIVANTLYILKDDDDVKEIFKDIGLKLSELTEDENKSREKIRKALLDKEITNIIIKDLDENKSSFEKIKKNLAYFGFIERYFYAIINPKKHGPNNFWKLVRFYWGAYYSIAKRIHEKYPVKTKKFDSNETIKKMVKEIYKIDYKAEAGEVYYSLINEKDYVLTTNYTPILSSYKDDEKTAYLAGRMDLFEIADKNKVVNINEVEDNDIIFPFILCQSPIKPIVSSVQIKEYAKAIDFLNASKQLIIIGYNINEDDNHINSMIAEFISKKDNELIYFQYRDDKENTKKDICDKLKMSEDAKNIIVIAISNVEDVKKGLNG